MNEREGERDEGKEGWKGRREEVGDRVGERGRREGGFLALPK